MRILLAEDDPAIATLVSSQLQAAGFLTDVLAEGPEVLERGETTAYSAIVLDLGLPGLDGLSILKRWRKAGVQTPILILTARGSWMERVDGFDAGADDYLPKPFRSEELLARLRALLRRSQMQQYTHLTAGRFELDQAGRRVYFDSRQIELSVKEYRLIAYLAAHKNTVVSAVELAARVQGKEDDYAKNAVEAMITRIRKKTAPTSIQTRRGFGYMLSDDRQ